jgi:hypothetical protein
VCPSGGAYGVDRPAAGFLAARILAGHPERLTVHRSALAESA